MNKYLIEFIINFTLGSIFIVTVPFLMYFLNKDMLVKRQIVNGYIPHMHKTKWSRDSLSRTKAILFYLSQTVLAIIIVSYFIFIEIPSFRDIPSLVTGNLLYSEGVVSEVERNKSLMTIYINNVKVKESTWFKSRIEPYAKYKISYLKHSKYIIKAEKIE